MKPGMYGWWAKPVAIPDKPHRKNLTFTVEDIYFWESKYSCKKIAAAV